tara:strand:+ start:215 stop:775 length:561 start_codon:yes stop_codon:yes gene_type:complete
MLGLKKNEVSLFLDVVNVIFEKVREKMPKDASIKSSHREFKIARRTNPKMIFNNIGTYLLVPFASVVERGDFDQLLNTIMSSSVYQENKKEYEEFIENVVFKPIALLSPTEKSQMMKNFLTLLQLYKNYYARKNVHLPLDQMIILTDEDLKATRGVIKDIMSDNGRPQTAPSLTRASSQHQAYMQM